MRTCDVEARRLLGPGRGSSVFPAPIRPVLTATSYTDACQVGVQIEGKKLSHQTWAISSKIHDVDQVVRQNAELPMRVYEVHPEVCFYFLAGGRPIKYRKKRKDGREEQQKLLEPIFSP
jgi:predicted RNase H-like nuclease